MKDNKYKSFNYIMKPRSVAIIGASNNPDKVGHIIMQNYIDVGYSGELYPVNMNDSSVLGIKAYKSVMDIKKNIDLAVIAVPAEVVPKVAQECANAKVKSMIVVSGGFAEVGNTKLQDELLLICKKNNIPLVGPNCLGVMDPRSRVDTLFLPTFKIDRPRVGGVSFASQSGAVGSSVLDMISSEGFGLSKFISYGNAIDLDEVDIIKYLGEDTDTKVIVFYIEGVKRGREFMQAATKVSMKKPIVIAKGGRTKAGSTAAHSHTASLAGSYEAYRAVFKQSGIIQAMSLDEILNFSKIFDTQPLLKGNRIGIITNGGGTGVMATDALYDNGFVLPQLKKEAVNKLTKVMPKIVNIRLPLDMAGDADDKRFGAALDVMMNEEEIDAIIVIALFQTPGADSRVAATLIHYGTLMKKPLLVVSPGGSYTQAHKNMMESSGVPVYTSPENAIKALAVLRTYTKFRMDHV